VKALGLRNSLLDGGPDLPTRIGDGMGEEREDGRGGELRGNVCKPVGNIRLVLVLVIHFVGRWTCDQ